MSYTLTVLYRCGTSEKIECATEKEARKVAAEEAKWESTGLVTCDELNIEVEGDFAYLDY